MARQRALDKIRDYRLENVESLHELEGDVTKALVSVNSSTALQDFLPILEQFCAMKRRTISSIQVIDDLEEKLMNT